MGKRVKMKRGFFINFLFLIFISLGSIYSQDNNTEFGVADDLTVWGISGTYDDPDVEIKGLQYLRQHKLYIRHRYQVVPAM